MENVEVGMTSSEEAKVLKEDLGAYRARKRARILQSVSPIPSAKENGSQIKVEDHSVPERQQLTPQSSTQDKFSSLCERLGIAQGRAEVKGPTRNSQTLGTVSGRSYRRDNQTSRHTEGEKVVQSVEKPLRDELGAESKEMTTDVAGEETTGGRGVDGGDTLDTEDMVDEGAQRRVSGGMEHDSVDEEDWEVNRYEGDEEGGKVDKCFLKEVKSATGAELT